MIPLLDPCANASMLCAIQDLTEAVKVDPWPVFWLTLAATFLGAVAGALVVWWLSRGQQKRDREDRKQEREQDRLDREGERAQAMEDRRSEIEIERLVRQAEREQDQRARFEERLDVAVATVVERIGALDAAVRGYQFALSAGGMSVEPPHGARGRLLASIRVAQMAAVREIWHRSMRRSR
ncbi:hypothetical protein ACLQ2Q_13315 [Microbacterium sp. DT81.1]|uniref:hypothetical protein n=1 Tax=Microbacterium sp. DT81.1 TaxID=3393413 RepID=UPI003CFB6985